MSVKARLPIKNITSAIFLILLAILFVTAFFWYLHKDPLISPVLGISKSRLSDNVWFPKSESVFASGELPEITAQSAFFIETSSGEILYEKNPDQRLKIASLVKIMTIIVALENRSLDELLTVSSAAAEYEPDKMYLKSGEKLKVEELLKGIFLVSANDAAEVLARESTGRREEFINLMNSKASQLGMVNSHFINPTGLEEDDPQDPTKLRDHYSTAYDVALMSRYAIHRWPFLLDISSQSEIFIPQSDLHQEYSLVSGINLLTTYPGVKGFKTGYTPEAGLTLVTVAEKEGHQVLGVLLGSTNRRDDAKYLLDYSFQKLRGG